MGLRTGKDTPYLSGDCRKLTATRCLEKVPAKIMKEFVRNHSAIVEEKLNVVLSEFKAE